jgi:DNA-binding response OmpR family regulator
LRPVTSPPTAPLILIVDDDESLRVLLTSALEPRGYRTLGAANGREGLDAVARETPSLVVLDYWMPIVDGAGFMRELSAMLAELPPVILFTAVADDPRLARDLGVDVYVEKPVDLSRFLKLVDATVRAGKQARPAIPLPGNAERRRAIRRRMRRAVEVRLEGAQRFAPAFTVDLSESGVCLDLGFIIEPGAHLAVGFVLADGRRVELCARVSRATPDGRVGVEWVRLDEPRRELLAALLRA